jgi:hypothetical protein
MSDESLFDKSLPPDPEVERLEKLLASERWKPAAPPRLPRPWPRVLSRPLSRVAAIVVAAGGLAATGLWLAHARGGATQFELADASGDVRVVDGLLSTSTPADATGGGTLRRGARVVCGSGASARVRVADVGYVTLEGDTRVRVERSAAPDESAEREGAFQLYLERGSVSASIFAAPRIFELGTPSGIAVDLGCIYRTTVDDAGHTTLSVVLGKVSFEAEGRKVHVPSHASCRALPGVGPGTPVWDDAGDAYRADVETLDGSGDASGRARGATTSAPLDPATAAALEHVLEKSRTKDSLTLWHLLDDPRAQLRVKVFDRLAELVPPPDLLKRETFERAPRKDRGKDDGTTRDAGDPIGDELLEKWESAVRSEW